MISIIIPTCNRDSYLKQTLASLAKQEFPSGNFEILIIDNASTDKTKDIAENFIKQNKSISVKYFYEPIPGLLSGRHRGAKEAKGDILVFIDDDIIASPDWLQAIHDSFSNSDVHIVGGKCLPKYEIEPPYWTDYLWTITDTYKMCGYYSLIDQGNNIKETDPNFIFGLNFSIRKNTLFELGGFHPDCIPKQYQRFQGDGETGLTMKLKAKELKALYNPKALLHHWVTKERMTFEYIEKRMFYQGVCKSYADIRKSNLNTNYEALNKNSSYEPEKVSLNRKLIRRIAGRDIKDEVRSLKREIDILRQELRDSNPMKTELFERMRIAYSRGYEFHQNEVKSDPKLLKWVLKEDYFDYDYLKDIQK